MIKNKWTLQFQCVRPTQNGTQSRDIYTLEQQNQARPFFIISIPHGNLELVLLLEKAINGVPEQTLKEEYDFLLKNIFHGPWIVNELTQVKYIQITEQEVRQLTRIIFRESAERNMADSRYEQLKKEFRHLQKAHELQGQELLRLKMRTPHDYDEQMKEAYPEKTVTLSDLFDQTTQQMNLPEPIDMACRKDIVQIRRN